MQMMLDRLQNKVDRVSRQVVERDGDGGSFKLEVRSLNGEQFTLNLKKHDTVYKICEEMKKQGVDCGNDDGLTLYVCPDLGGGAKGVVKDKKPKGLVKVLKLKEVLQKIEEMKKVPSVKKIEDKIDQLMATLDQKEDPLTPLWIEKDVESLSDMDGDLESSNCTSKSIKK